MLITRSLRTGTGLLALAALMMLFALNLGGCSDENASPTALPQTTAPILPDPAELQFDFSFFDKAADLDKNDGGIHENFVNAYLRAVLLGAIAELTLAPPVATFSAALHTVPVAQDDGAWIWSYDWNDYNKQFGNAVVGFGAVEIVTINLSLKAHPSALAVRSAAKKFPTFV